MRRLLPDRVSLAVTVVLLVGGLGVTGALVAFFGAEEPFPHEAHEGLFPLCEGCHVGVITGAEAELFPAPANCAECHDGVRRETVEWAPPGPRASNLRFFHPEHRGGAGSHLPDLSRSGRPASPDGGLRGTSRGMPAVPRPRGRRAPGHGGRLLRMPRPDRPGGADPGGAHRALPLARIARGARLPLGARARHAAGAALLRGLSCPEQL